MKKIITCAGYHGTGSSVITDLLKEFRGIKSFGEYEFRFLQDPNGVGDLEEKLLRNNNRLNSDRAIYDFKRYIKKIYKQKKLKFWKKNMYKKVFNEKFLIITDEYLKEMIDLEWRGNWLDSEMRDREFFNKILFKIKKIIFNIFFVLKKVLKLNIMTTPILENFYFSYPIENFEELTKKYTEKLWEATQRNEKVLAFDQLVPVCNINKYIRYFNNIKIIVMDRDPRDLYILSKCIWKDERVIPVENVEIFIKHFKLIRKHKDYETYDRKNVINLRFEDIIYNYEKTLEKITSFLELDIKEHIYAQKYFNPNISINNTQLFLEYGEFQEDIKIIERELKEYCYDFPYMVNRNKKNNIF